MTETQPVFVAHRGMQSHFPENTLLACQQAAANGCRYIEIDIQFSADGEPVVYHDTDLQRISGSNKKLSELTLAQLQGLPAHEPKRFGEQFIDCKISSLATLATWLRATPKITLFVELKPEILQHYPADKIVKRVSQVLTGLEDQVVLISFSERLVDEVIAQRRFAAGLVLSEWQQNYDHWQQLSWIFCDIDLITEDFHFPEQGPDWVLYETSDMSQVWRFHDQGCRFFESYQAVAFNAQIAKD